MVYGLSLILALLLSVGVAYTAPTMEAGRFANSAVEARGLEEAIRTGLDKVEEVTFLRQEMAKLGLKRGWLFGGTAAAFGHYVNWDLHHRLGDKRFQPHRFDYDYTNIFRSTQDLDIVIDGTPEQAEALERRLREVYPHLQGTQSAWEVRLLSRDRGSKEALLGNPNFLNQHTDSNSTGLIEFTQPPRGESVVSDLRDPGAKNPKFFEDIRLGKLKFYFSDLHHITNRFKQGLNPPIFSVVRYFTKLFQYELQIDPEDKRNLQKIINEFQPSSLAEQQALSWIQKNGKKLFQNAVNLEYAANTLDEFGLRKKLMELDSANTPNTLSWWLNRKPLASKPVGTGEGATASSLGLSQVAHETSDYLAYESITRSHTGEPNVFTSRENAVGEAAAFGEGFYTKVGRDGARGTGITIRFNLNPSAREGTDFTYDRNAGFVVVHNKQALRVIQESLDLTPRQFFEILIQNGATWGEGDKSILEKFKRRMSKQLLASPKEMEEVAGMVTSALVKGESNPALLNEWLALAEKNKKNQKLIEKFLRPLTKSENSWVSIKANYVLAEAGLPSSLDIAKPYQTYFEALRAIGKSWQTPTDPHFAKINSKAKESIATIADLKKIFQLIQSDISTTVKANDDILSRSPLMQAWSDLWQEMGEKHPIELKEMAKEIAENKNILYEPRYRAMDYLSASLKTQPDPSLIELFFSTLDDKDRPVGYRAIFGLRDFAASDPRTAPALAKLLDNQDNVTLQHTLKAFETVKTSDPAIHHKLIETLASERMWSSNAVASLKNNIPSDPLSELKLEQYLLHENKRFKNFAIEVLGAMPNPTPRRIAHFVEALQEKNTQNLVINAAKNLLKHPEHRPKAMDALMEILRKGPSERYMIESAEILMKERHKLAEVKDLLGLVLAKEGGYSWRIRPMISQIEDQLVASPVQLNCPQSFKALGHP